MRPPVLFVDDSPVARSAATQMLREQGLEVTALGSSKEAESVDGSSVSAALLDLDLGDGFGTEVAERLRRSEPALPIAFLTAGGPTRLLVVAERLGPVFSKVSEVEAAVRWIAEAATARPG